MVRFQFRRKPPVRIKFYTSKHCGSCALARRILQRVKEDLKNRVVIEEVDVNEEDDRMEREGIFAVPTVDIEGVRLVGMDEIRQGRITQIVYRFLKGE